MLSLMAILPGSLIAVHAQPPSVFITPAANAGDVGSTFLVSVQASDVGMLVGYDVVVNYDNTVLSVQSATFTGCDSTGTCDVFNGLNAFGVNAGCSDTTGSCEGTFSLLGGQTVDLSASSGQLYSITFKVISANNAAIDVARADIAADIGGSVQPVTVSTAGATFVVPPVLSLVSPFATVPKTAYHLKHHEVSVTISANIIYNSSNVRAGFGGVQFDVIAPNGVDTPVQSNIAFFLNPGTSGTVSAVYTFNSAGNALGHYTIIVTLLRCVDANTCVTGNVATSPNFFMVKA
jgi:hypothetical protein